MNLSRPFILRPVATLLLSLALTLLGTLAYRLLPVAPLPQVDFPTILVSASLAGASPETMAATVAAPLERAMGQIAGITEMTSTSSQGSSNIIIQFDLSRDIDGAARDVQAAINAARSLLPSSMKTLPTYRKANPSDAPILLLALTSSTLDKGQLYDLASSKLQQRIAQVQGVGEVSLLGSALPAVRIELQPQELSQYGISLDTVRTTVANATTNLPKGDLSGDALHWWIEGNGQLTQASEYRDLVVAYRNGTAVKLSDVAKIYDSVQDLYVAGYYNSQPSVIMGVTRSSGANMLSTIDAIKAQMSVLQEMLPPGVTLSVAMDRSPTIRESLRETEGTLAISVLLVIAVVFTFLRNARALLIPAVALPISLIGTCAAMYLLDYSLDTLSLMALIIATGFVVDDAIVVLENISRHLEEGATPMAAALQGSKEVGFTVLSMTVSLIAVFIPLLLMGGIVGRLFREFAVTLSVSLLLSMLISLTLTPMLCARLLRPHDSQAGATSNRLYRGIERVLDWVGRSYATSLAWVMRHKRLTLLSLVLTVVGNLYLYTVVQKGFFPDQDTGMLMGQMRADQNTSFQALHPKLLAFSKLIQQDPDVQAVLSATGSGGFGSRNTGNFFVLLKDSSQRKQTATQVANRLSMAAAGVPGASLFLMAGQDLRMGGRSANATYQYSLQSDNLDTLRAWTPKVYAVLRKLPQLTSVDSDAQSAGQEVKLVIDRKAARRLGLNVEDIDTFLNNAFSQRQIATQYQTLNQYYTILGLAPAYTQVPSVLNELFVLNGNGDPVPLSAFARIESGNAPLSVAHQNQMATSTIAFNLADGVSLPQAKAAIDAAVVGVGLPTTIHGSMQGTAKASEALVASMPWLILAALLAVYIVLGMLYESWIHPITILSTLPSAGVGALLLLLATGTQLTVIALIGILLLIGIVKKNAILMIDFALHAERERNLAPEQAILEACRMRLRPILMTTLAAFFGALPMVLQSGGDAGLRRPLGLAICGGLALSQLLTLYTTPVVYVYLDRLGTATGRLWRGRRPSDPARENR
ncbi:efflux RND transporter permease subunit [Bordetella sp. N]|uniref:efflux RND transporter permease subunit n=1 Tax=Bordetella sp. N TaxID=1746199 RepID=UPI00070B7DD8|nr:efflux RND transporter permease subunit [Bordetella sp. N]ALM84585.1 multidrug transporter [Bordetella sp. N]